MSPKKLETTSLARLFEKMTDGVLILDSQWNILFANSLARGYLNIPFSAKRIQEELIPKLSQHYILSADLVDVAINSERSITFEAENRSEHSFDTVLSLYMSRATEEGLRFLLIRDVTSERREELLKRNFLSLISHKLLTPITVIKQYLESMGHGVLGPVSDKQEKAVAAGLKNLRRLSDIVQRLLAFTRMQGEHPGEILPHLDAMAFAQKFCREFEERAQGKKVTIDVAAAEGDTTVAAREAPLGVILENILGNAVKFATANAVRIRLEGRRSHDSGEFCLSIRDDGPGIPPPVLKNVFKAFTQRDDDFTGNVDGLGLGLPMVKHLMEVFGGRVALESTPGAGTAVSLTFPPVD